jgi:Tfp pilus assembly protein PilN
MFSELTNLLPGSRVRAFRRGYFLRVATLALLLIAGVIIVHGLLLLPTYLFAHTEVSRESEHLAGLNATLQTSEEKQVQTRLGMLASGVTYLDRLATTTTASAAITAILQVPHAGISLNGLTPPGATAGIMSLSGVASSRDTLQQFSNALSRLPFITNADLPISAYAKDTNIPFTITLTGTLRP